MSLLCTGGSVHSKLYLSSEHCASPRSDKTDGIVVRSPCRDKPRDQHYMYDLLEGEVISLVPRNFWRPADVATKAYQHANTGVGTEVPTHSATRLALQAISG